MFGLMGVFSLLNNFKNVFFQSELRRKLLFTLGVLAVYRFGFHVPLPGINTAVLAGFINSSAMATGFLKYFDLLSGGALKRVAVLALGISPYIQASIFMQLAAQLFPSLEALSKEGEHGRRVLNGYTRFLGVALAFVQGFSYILYIEKTAPGLIINPGWGFRVFGTLVLVVGAVFVMWLGEQILQRGIGQGSSMIIFASIVATLPEGVYKLVNAVQTGNLEWLIGAIVVAFMALLVCAIIFLEKGERRVNVQYAKRVIGQKVYGGVSRHIPFKLNSVGVIPVIFTSAILGTPLVLLRQLLGFEWIAINIPFLAHVSDWLEYGSPLYTVLTVVFIIMFAFLYTSIMFNPIDLADNLRKSGGFIAGLRPGRQTSDFFDMLLVRITLPGAVYLASLAVLPDIILKFLSSPIGFSGTSLLIAVGVGLDTSTQLDAALLDRKYEGFLSYNKAKKRYDY